MSVINFNIILLIIILDYVVGLLLLMNHNFFELNFIFESEVLYFPLTLIPDILNNNLYY